MGISLFKLLFKDSEHICYGDEYAKYVSKQPNSALKPFYCINPLHPSLDHRKSHHGLIKAFKKGNPIPDEFLKRNELPGSVSSGNRRADLNVTQFRNFLFEMDNTPLANQLTMLRDCGFPWAAIVYSGGKSYHAILSLENSLSAPAHTSEGVDEYKRTWKQLAHVLTSRLNQPLTLLDTSCQNPSRLSRFPGYMRDGNEQALISLGTVCSDVQFHEILSEAPDIGMSRKQVIRPDISAQSEEELRLFMPSELYAKLRFPATWAQGTAGNYPELFKLTLWLADATNASRDIIISFLSKNTFPTLQKMGYPVERMNKAVEDALNLKGL